MNQKSLVNKEKNPNTINNKNNNQLKEIKKNKKKYIVMYRNKGKYHQLTFNTKKEQKECELFINELYEEGLLL
jgi:hypothetical protein